MSSHPIVHIEIPATNPTAASSFYASLFGWSMTTEPQMDYTMFTAEGGPGGGLPKVDGANVKVGEVLISVGTDDIDATLAKAGSLGGRTLVAKTEIPGMGWYAIFSDPTGNRIGLFTGRPA